MSGPNPDETEPESESDETKPRKQIPASSKTRPTVRHRRSVTKRSFVRRKKR